MQNDKTDDTKQGAARIRSGDWIGVIVLAAVLILVVTGAILRYVNRDALVIQGDGMAPTIHTGDKVHVDRDAACCRRGEIVVFDAERAPGWEGTQGPNRVSRAIGLPGDVVSQCMDVLVCVNGDVLVERYLRRGTVTVFPERLPRGCAPDSPVRGCRVPSGHVLMLGDNRRVADDSRLYGPVPLASVVGVVD